ncbi:WD repeat-containing protein 91-like isoform X1 [Equus przewalskii]|uniref:WD repeat-containing protein 91 n=1 Tax=Equus przewalskii TaxID=9798 RepID=A0ABM4P9N1_EQUPR
MKFCARRFISLGLTKNPTSPKISRNSENQILSLEETSIISTAKGKEPACGPKDRKSLFSGLATGESSWSQHRQQHLQDHGKERKELLSLTLQCAEKKPEASGPEGEPCPELHVEAAETLTRASTAGPDGGGVHPEQPFTVLGQEEYGEHHSSIMHCRVDCSGRRVASLDVDRVIKVWSFNPIMQTKASSISKSPLLSLEWATKRDRLLLLGSGMGTVRLYETEAKKSLCEITIHDDMPRILSLACSPSGASFVCSAAAPSLTSQGDFLAPDIGSKGTNQVPGKLLLWDTKTMKQQLQFSLDPEPIAIHCTAFNHNGNLLVTGAADGVIRLFDMQQHECAMSWRAHCGELYSVEFSYDENTVYSIGEDGKHWRNIGPAEGATIPQRRLRVWAHCVGHLEVTASECGDGSCPCSDGGRRLIRTQGGFEQRKEVLRWEKRRISLSDLSSWII